MPVAIFQSTGVAIQPISGEHSIEANAGMSQIALPIPTLTVELETRLCYVLGIHALHADWSQSGGAVVAHIPLAGVHIQVRVETLPRGHRHHCPCPCKASVLCLR